MSIPNLNNWFNFLTGRRTKELKDTDILPIGRQDSRSFNGWSPVSIRYGDLKKEFGKGLGGKSQEGGGILSEISIQLRKHPTEQEVFNHYTGEENWTEFYEEGMFSQVSLIRLDNGNLADLYYAQAIMPDGTLIFEAYDKVADHDPGEGNNGYWIAMQYGENQELVKVAELPMTSIFWNYWYDFTHMNAETNSVNFIWMNGMFRGDRTVEMSQVELTYSEAGGLQLVQEQYNDFSGATVSSMFLDEFGYVVGPLSPVLSTELEYDATNSYFGIMPGENIGWTWLTPGQDITKMIGINAFTYEIRTINLVTDADFLSIDNVPTPNPLLAESPPDELEARWEDILPNSELGFVLQLADRSLSFPDNYTNTGLTGFWSKYKSDPTKIAWLRFRNNEGVFQEFAGSFSGSYAYQFHGRHLTLLDVHVNGQLGNAQVIVFTRVNLDSDGSQPEVRIIPAPRVLAKDGLEPFVRAPSTWNTYPLENSVVFGINIDPSFPTFSANTYFGENLFFVWKDDETDPFMIHSSTIRPSHFYGNELVSKDLINGFDRKQTGHTVLKETYSFEF